MEIFTKELREHAEKKGSVLFRFEGDTKYCPPPHGDRLSIATDITMEQYQEFLEWFWKVCKVCKK